MSPFPSTALIARTALITALCCVPVTAAAAAETTPSPVLAVSDAPEGATVEYVNGNGNGCPQGAKAVEQPGKQGFTAEFTGFIAKAGKGADPVDSRRACQIAINVTAPKGWSYTLSAIDYAATLDVPAGGQVALKSLFYFQGMTKDVQVVQKYGAGKRDEQVHLNVPADQQIWKSCDTERLLNMKLSVEFDTKTIPADASASVEVKRMPFGLANLKWKKC